MNGERHSTIRARLAATLEGWFVDPKHPTVVCAPDAGAPGDPWYVCEVQADLPGDARGHAHAALIANAPDDLAFLLDEVKRAAVAFDDEVNRGIERDAKIGDAIRELAPGIADESIVKPAEYVRDVLGKLNAAAFTRLQAERDELAAEVAAYQGRPEGGLPGWIRGTYNDQPAWLRVFPDRTLAAYLDGAEWCWTLCIPGGYGAKPTPRAAMREAETCARSIGWKL